MSALARYFNLQGKQVAGYDKTPTNLTNNLIREGISIHFEDDIDQIPESLISMSKNEVLIVYTPAVPKNHSELNYFITNNYWIEKRSEILGLISKNSNTIAISGTHGKTTVSTMTAFFMQTCGIDCNAFLGGISKNFDSNLLLNEGSENTVVEADEYDRSFLKLFPNIAIITSIDADHLDIYSDISDIRNSFGKFVNQIKTNGSLIIKKGVELDLTAYKQKLYTYSITEKADFYAENIRTENGKSIFDFYSPKVNIKNIILGVPGRLNVENAVAAIAAVILHGAEPEKIRIAAEQFSGVKRRFDYVINKKNIVYIDDYAHHPEELKAFISSVKEMYKNKKITGIFQPHLFSRTKDFADDFAKSLSLLDEVVLLEIYPAREEPIEGVNSEMILNKITAKSKFCINKINLIEFINTNNFEVLLTMGAGDIDLFVNEIKNTLLIK